LVASVNSCCARLLSVFFDMQPHLSFQVNDFAAFTNFEVDSALTKLPSDFHTNLTRFAQALSGHDDLESVTLLSMICDPGTTIGSLQRVPSESIANKRQNSAPFTKTDFRSVISMRWYARDDEHRISLSSPKVLTLIVTEQNHVNADSYTIQWLNKNSRVFNSAQNTSSKTFTLSGSPASALLKFVISFGVGLRVTVRR